MTAPTEIRERAIALLDQLPGESLERAVEFLEALSHEALQESEAPKFKVDEEITDAEHQELLLYVDRVEQQDAERMEALIQLAKLRSCDLKIVIDEFLP
jgi:hypothetical protein